MGRETTQDVKNMLVNTNFSTDERIQHCLEACDSIEAVLKSLYRLDQKLKDAHERRHRINQDVKEGVKDMSEVDRIKLITEIDEGEDAQQATEALWQSFDVSN